jgi:hypothetical protein
MLAPLGFFLLTLLATCAVFLVASRALDVDRTGTKATDGRDRPLIRELPVHSHRGRSHFRRPSLRFSERCGACGLHERSPRRDRAR